MDGFSEKFTGGAWHLEEENGTLGVFSGEALLALVLADEVPDRSTQKANSHLIAAAPLLLKACKKVNELLGNCLLVTQDGFKIDATEVKTLITDAIYRAQGYRVDPRPE
jgi:proteasome assembly chaperone (PAC2) family protein